MMIESFHHFVSFFLNVAFYSTSACVILVAVLFGLLRSKRNKTIHLMKKLPGYMEDIPLIKALGYVRHLKNAEKRTGIPAGVFQFEAYLGLTDNYHRQNQGAFVEYMGGQPILVIFKANHMEHVLTHSTNLSKTLIYRFVEPWLGKSLLTSTGDHWRTQRKMLTPGFHFRILDDFSKIMNRHVKIFVDSIAEKPRCEDILHCISALTLDVICETIMGTSVNCQNSDTGKKYLDGVCRLSELSMSRIANPLIWNDQLYKLSSEYQELTSCLKVVHSFARKVIEDRKSELLNNPELLADNEKQEGDEFFIRSKKPFLDLMLQKHLNGELSVEDMRGQVDTFMFAGHDTTAMSLTFAVYLIGLHPEVQKKLHQEVDEAFSHEEDPECDVTSEHIRSLKYMDMVIKEAQRVYTPVPLVGRKLDEDMMIDENLIPKGTELHILFSALHRDPSVFPKPDEFIPERFSPEQTNNRNVFAFVPFSAGPRNCIGQKFALLELKIALCWLLRRFKWASLDQRDKMQIVAELVARPRNKIRIQFEKRFKQQ